MHHHKNHPIQAQNIHKIHKGSVTSNDSGLGFFNDPHQHSYYTTGSGSLSSHPPEGTSGQHSQLQQPSLQNAELALRQGTLNHLDQNFYHFILSL